MVHSSLEPPTVRPDFSFPVLFEDAQHLVHVRRRPGLKAFLEHVCTRFEVVLFTASHPAYANPLLDTLDPARRFFSHRLFYDSCLLVEGTYVKDLSVLGRDLKTTLIIDNTPQAFGFQLSNAVPILSWFDDTADRELTALLPLLDACAAAADVRPILEQRFGLAHRVQAAADAAFATALEELTAAAVGGAGGEGGFGGGAYDEGSPPSAAEPGAFAREVAWARTFGFAHQAEQLHGVPAAPATHALRDFAPRPRNAQHGTRSPAAEEVRGCCAARNATLHVAALTPVAAVSVSSGPRVHAALVHFERC
jgi:CTD small phosphatase-like protein 2